MDAKRLEEQIERNRAAGKPTAGLEKALAKRRRRDADKQEREAAKHRVTVKTYVGERALERGIVEMAGKGFAVQSQTAVKRGIPLLRTTDQKYTVTFVMTSS